MKNKAALNPPKRYPTPEGILVAKSRIAYEQEMWSIMYHLINYYKLKEGLPVRKIFTPEFLTKNAERAKKQWEDKLSNWIEGEIWEAFVDESYFKHNYLDVLNEPHYGDCIGIPDSCDRCNAESKLNIPTTVTWTKAQGMYMSENLEEEFEEK